MKRFLLALLLSPSVCFAGDSDRDDMRVRQFRQDTEIRLENLNRRLDNITEQLEAARPAPKCESFETRTQAYWSVLHPEFELPPHR